MQFLTKFYYMQQHVKFMKKEKEENHSQLKEERVLAQDCLHLTHLMNFQPMLVIMTMQNMHL